MPTLTNSVVAVEARLIPAFPPAQLSKWQQCCQEGNAIIVDIAYIDSSDDTSQELVLKQHPDRSTWSTVGASVQCGVPNAPVNRWRVKAPTGGTVLAELTALGNNGKVFVIFATPAEVAAMVTASQIPNS